MKAKEEAVVIIKIAKTSQILEKNHYGLASVKERILEYVAVLSLNRDRWLKEEAASTALLARRAPILCLVGLVGTGKTE